MNTSSMHLTDEQAKKILDMLARKAGGYEFTMFTSSSKLDAFLTPAVNYHDIFPAETNTRFLLKNNYFIYIEKYVHERAYSIILKKLLEIATEHDIIVNTMPNPVFMRKNTSLEELLVQLDLEV